MYTHAADVVKIVTLLYLKWTRKIPPCSSLRQIKLSCVLDYHDVHYSIENMHVPHCVISDYFVGLYIL